MYDADPRDEYFRRGEASGALLAAVQALAQRTGHTLDDLERMSLRDIYCLAVESYGRQLPEFWQTWHEWHEDWGSGHMGDAPLH